MGQYWQQRMKNRSGSLTDCLQQQVEAEVLQPGISIVHGSPPRVAFEVLQRFCVIANH